MTSENRDPAFWDRIAAHPEVRPTLYGQPPERVGEAMQRAEVQPFTGPNGGWIFVRLDAHGLVWDIHAMFTPDGWGREAHAVLKAALRSMFETAHLVFNYETANPRSRPPLSFGFRPTGGETLTALGLTKSWVLTRSAWEDSPAFRRA